MKKNIQNTIDSNWKSYQAVAQANIQSLEDLEIISYTRFNSSTRLNVGDDILVNNKLARIGSVIVDEIYGHQYTIAYPGMSLGVEEIIFETDWVLPTLSILPENNNITEFTLEEASTNELVIDSIGTVERITLTPYKTLVTHNVILDNIYNAFQTDFKGTETIDITEVGPNGTINTNTTLTSPLGTTFSEYKLSALNVVGDIIVNGVVQTVETIQNVEKLPYIIEPGAIDSNLVIYSDTYTNSNISIGGFKANTGIYTFSFILTSVGNTAINIAFVNEFSSTKNDEYMYPQSPYRKLYPNGCTDLIHNFIIDTDNNTCSINGVTISTDGNETLKIGNDTAGSTTTWDISNIPNEKALTTYVSQTVDNSVLDISFLGTLENINYTTTISTPTDISIDISKTLTQDPRKANWTKYQLTATNIDGTISVNGVEQIVESTNNITNIVDIDLTVNPLTGYTNVTKLDEYTFNFTGQFATVAYDIPPNIGLLRITYTLTQTGTYGAYFGFGDSPTVAMENVHMSADKEVTNSNSIGDGIFEYVIDTTNLFNKSIYFSDGSSLNTGSFQILSAIVEEPSYIKTTFTEQLVDTNTLELSVNGTVTRIDIKTYINEDIITTITDTDSITTILGNELPYTITQQSGQTDFNGYLVSTIGLDNGAKITVNGIEQTISSDIQGACTLSTTNDLYDIVRTFDYDVIAKENIIADYTFIDTNTFTSPNDYTVGSNLLLDNLNYAEITGKELIQQYNIESGELGFNTTLTLTRDITRNNWAKYQFSALNVVGDFTVNDIIQTVERIEQFDIDFRYIFERGISIEGGTINLNTSEIYGYRVNGTGPKGYYSVDMQHLYDLGLKEIKFNVTSGYYGAVYIGRLVDGIPLDVANTTNVFYNVQNVDFTLNLETKSVEHINGSMDSRYTAVPDLSLVELKDLVIGTCATQARNGLQKWTITPTPVTKTFFTETLCDTNELIITGNTPYIYYDLAEKTHLLPHYTITYKDYTRTLLDGVVTHSFNTSTQDIYNMKSVNKIKKVVFTDMATNTTYLSFGSVGFFNNGVAITEGDIIINDPTYFKATNLTINATSTYPDTNHYVGNSLIGRTVAYPNWSTDTLTNQTVTYTFTEEQIIDRLDLISHPIHSSYGMSYANIKFYDINDNLINTIKFSQPSTVLNQVDTIALSEYDILPSTMKTFDFPALSLSYYDIDSGSTIGPITKEYDNIIISDNSIIFDYNDEIKVNTNKIDFQTDGIKEILIDIKKIQKEL